MSHIRPPSSRLPTVALSLVFLVAGSSCEQPEPSAAYTHWVWTFVDTPTMDDDGFPHLQEAVRLVNDPAGGAASVPERAIDEIVIAAKCKRFSGRPKEFVLQPIGEVFFDRLAGDTGEIAYEDLQDALVSLLVFADEQLIDSDPEAAVEVAESIVAAAQQMGSNGEDNLLALIRQAVWYRSLELMQAGYRALGRDDAARRVEPVFGRIDREREEVRHRDSDRLYHREP
ncbi:MAG: hypothetical protein SYC29_18215 [Planctomycetota bacterium]|nr:hypothetical protein [Planctomycetota bacterium]